MATLSYDEMEQLMQQLQEKKEEIRVIYDKLVEAGAAPLPADFLDEISGGLTSTQPPLPSLFFGEKPRK